MKRKTGKIGESKQVNWKIVKKTVIKEAGLINQKCFYNFEFSFFAFLYDFGFQASAAKFPDENSAGFYARNSLSETWSFFFQRQKTVDHVKLDIISQPISTNQVCGSFQNQNSENENNSHY